MYWRTVAVDRRLIPSGSRVFVPAYCARPNRGWFLARDTGGAILGRHVDVYRPAPGSPGAAQRLTDQRVFIVPPQSVPGIRRLPRCPRGH